MLFKVKYLNEKLRKLSVCILCRNKEPEFVLIPDWEMLFDEVPRWVACCKLCVGTLMMIYYPAINMENQMRAIINKTVQGIETELSEYDKKQAMGKIDA